jgi:hypothetical protein
MIVLLHSFRKSIRATSAIITTRGIITGRIVSWRWASVVSRSVGDVGVRRVVTAIRLLETATGRGVIVDGTTSTGWRAVATAIILIVAATGWASISVPTIAARAVATRTTALILIRSTMRTARSRRAGSSAVARDIRLSISNTADGNTLKLSLIKLLYCRLEISSSLELNKASFAITVTTRLRVDYVKA